MLPPGLQRALNAVEERNSFTAKLVVFNPDAYTTVYGHQMAIEIIDADLPALIEHREELEQMIAPANGNMETAEVLYGLMALYAHQTEKASRERKQQLADTYLEDLAEYPTWAIAEACKEWRRENEWRPLICHLRQLCQKKINPIRRRLDILGEAINHARSAGLSRKDLTA